MYEEEKQKAHMWGQCSPAHTLISIWCDQHLPWLHTGMGERSWVYTEAQEEAPVPIAQTQTTYMDKTCEPASTWNRHRHLGSCQLKSPLTGLEHQTPAAQRNPWSTCWKIDWETCIHISISSAFPWEQVVSNSSISENCFLRTRFLSFPSV